MLSVVFLSKSDGPRRIFLSIGNERLSTALVSALSSRLSDTSLSIVVYMPPLALPFGDPCMCAVLELCTDVRLVYGASSFRCS